MSGLTLQSPDDREATYRKKGNEAARGYVANISETCHPENEVQLITSVSVESEYDRRPEAACRRSRWAV